MRRIWLTAGLAGAMLLAGCGNNAGGGSASEDAITIMVIGPGETQSFSYPEGLTAAEAAAEEINANGGIDGKDLKVITCNDKNDSATAGACAREAVTEQVSAVVGFFTIYGTQIFPILEAAQIPWIGGSAITPVESNSAMSFPTSGAAFAGSSAALAVKAGAKRIAVLQSETPAADENTRWLKLGAAAHGAEVVADVRIPPNTVDVAPYIERLLDANPDGIASTASLPDTPKVWAELAARGNKIPQSHNLAIVPLSMLKEAGAAVEGLYLVGDTPALSSSVDGVPEYRAASKKYTPEAPVSQIGLRTYAAVHLFAEIVEQAGGSSSEEVLSFLNKEHDLNVAWYKNLNFAGDGPYEQAPRVHVDSAFVFQVENSELSDQGIVEIVK